MSKISAYGALTAPVGADLLVVDDVSDATMASSGTTKKLALADLFGLQGLKFMTGTGAFGSTAGTITATTISNAISAGFTGLYLDPRFVWDATGLVIKDVSNFRIKSHMNGSVGWSGAISYNTNGFVKTDSSTTADGIQVYSDGTTECQGVIFEGLAIVGNNSNATVHLGGRQRRIGFPQTFIYNTNNTQTTVAAGSNGVNVSTFAGAGTLNVASSASFASSGNVVVATNTVMATIKYTGKGTGTLTGCTTLGGAGTLATGGTVGQAAFGLCVDTALNTNNSENSDFGPQLTVAGGNCAIGYGINDQSQHCNDSLASGLTTASGLVSIVAMTASNITHLNYYDRSSPTLCTVANHSGILTFAQGEALNGSTSGPHDLVNSNAATIYISRTLTQVTATNTMVIAGGAVHAMGRTRWAGTIPISGSGTLNLADPAGSYSALTVTGGTGNVLLLSGQYSPGSAPTHTGFTGTLHTTSWV